MTKSDQSNRSGKSGPGGGALGGATYREPPAEQQP